ncbi:MAG: DUF5063 domain-containing protein [Muribaculaceae bacterium]|nr:DUF5063 domain-containing protein [Muribaculaceae bacterium]
MEQKLTPNSLALIALSVEYCRLMEAAPDSDRDEFVTAMLKLLPRLYISATDIDEPTGFSEYYIDDALDEATYDAVRAGVAALIAEDDVYLEVFLSDMKYSDTPIATSISENLADIYQELYNFVVSVRDATTDVQQELLAQCRDNFVNYWGSTLVNVLRALHQLM